VTAIALPAQRVGTGELQEAAGRPAVEAALRCGNQPCSPLSDSAGQLRMSDEIIQTDGGPTKKAPGPAPPVPEYWENPTPLFYFEKWDLRALSPRQRNEIKAKLFAVHASRLEGNTGDPPEVSCWRRAYDIFAEQFLQVGALTKDLLAEGIPAMVLDASASGRWLFGRSGVQLPYDVFRIPFGNEFYAEHLIFRLYLPLLQGRIAEW